MISNSHLTWALKEWAIAVDALARGKTIVLLRKGGIRERHGRFEVQRDRVLLYPTYEHQKPHLLAPDVANRVEPVPSGWHPDRVEFIAWADITDVIAVANSDEIAALLPFHIWTERFAVERFRWKPRQPLYVLLLRAYRLSSPIALPYRETYGGCKSWIEIKESISIAHSCSVLSEAEYARRVERVRQALSNARSAAIASDPIK